MSQILSKSTSESLIIGKSSLIEEISNLLLLSNKLGGVQKPFTIYGQHIAEISFAVKGALISLGIRFIYVNCYQYYSESLFLQAIVDQFINNKREYPKIENFADFIDVLNTDSKNSYPFYLILDNSSHLSNLNPFLLPCFIQIRDFLEDLNLSVIILVDKLINGESYEIKCRECITIFFSQYSREDAIKILIQMAPEGILLKHYNFYISSLYDIISPINIDIYELNRLSTRLYQEYIQPIKTGIVKFTESVKLIRHLETIVANNISNNLFYENEYLSKRNVIDLPKYGKYLLIAAFLSSHNSSKLDTRLFVTKSLSPSRRKHKDLKTNNISKIINKNPVFFSVSRIFSILCRIIGNQPISTIHLYSLLSGLVCLGLVIQSRASSIDISTPMYKCAASYSVISKLSQTVGFQLNCYLL